MPVQKERRRYKRIEARIKISFHQRGEKKIYPSLIINMSQGGMLIKSSRAFPLDLILVLIIEKGEFSFREIHLHGRVSRCEAIYEKELYHIALDLDRSQEEYSRNIDDFYNRVLEWKKKDSEERLNS